MNTEKLPITGPCPIDLDAIGFDRTAKQAHCAHCDKSVHNLSNMTKGEAKAFLAENAGKKLCVSYSRERDGTILFKSACATAEPRLATVVPLSRVRASARRAAMPTAAALGLAAALAACAPHGPDPTPHGNPTKIEHVEPIKVQPKEPDVVMAGMMPIPEKIEPEVVDGEMDVPDTVEGRIELPEPVQHVKGEMAIEIPDEPCDKTKGNP